MTYEIKLQGHLGQQWTEWFDGATIALQDSGETVLTCLVVDQAALHGLLKKVRDLGMPLISVNRAGPGHEIRQMSNRKLMQAQLSYPLGEN